MQNNSQNNKRIVKNTLLLYVRMFFMMMLSLYTSRIVLATLGIEDYGIYNVIGSVVAMFTFLSSAMGNATSRYITFTLGLGDLNKLNKVFNTAVYIHIFISFVIFILAETIGLWFLNNHMTIPSERIVAANWVYQFSILSTVLAIINVPFMAEIISHEKMSAFAYLSILDGGLKLLIVYMLLLTTVDKLIFYSAAMLGVYIIDLSIYWIYCKKNFCEIKLRKVWDKNLFRSMIGFAGWSIIGNLIWIGYSQGLNILLNIFCGPTVNAARGIAFQVQGVVKGFVTNFQMAVNPQITKSYAVGDLERVKDLIFNSSKFSFFLLLAITLPIMIEADHILGFWLVEVPDHAVNFVILTLLMLLYTPLENPIGVSNDATGKIRDYQIAAGSINIFIVIVGYVFLKLGFAPESVFIEQFIFVSIVQVVKVYMVHKKINISMKEYMLHLLLPVWYVVFLAAIPPLLAKYYITNKILSLLIVLPLSVLSVIICSYIVGLDKKEKIIVKNQIKKIIHKIKR